MRKVKIILILFIMSMIITHLAHAVEYYVSVTGSDIIGDGTSINPWRTIQFGVNQIYEQDATLHVLSGTYEEHVVVQLIAEGLHLLGAGADVT